MRELSGPAHDAYAGRAVASLCPQPAAGPARLALSSDAHHPDPAQPRSCARLVSRPGTYSLSIDWTSLELSAQPSSPSSRLGQHAARDAPPSLPLTPTSILLRRPWRPSRGGRPAHPYGLLRHLLSTTWMSLRLPSLPGRAAQTGEGPRAVSVGRRLRPSRSARTLHASGRQVSHVQLHCGDSSRIRLQRTSLVKPTRDRR